jgi:predicted ATP-binding protein involved in virulence
MTGLFIVFVAGLVLGYLIGGVIVSKRLVQATAALLSELGVSKDDIEQIRLQRKRDRQQADVAAINGSITEDSLNTMTSAFTPITLVRENSTVYAYHDDKFIAQARSLEELHTTLNGKYDAIAFIIEDEELALELSELTGNLHEVTVDR